MDLMFGRIVTGFLEYLLNRKICGIAQVTGLRTELAEMLALLSRTTGWRDEQFKDKRSWFL